MCIISHSHNFIFFKIPKTGSTSVHEVLKPYIDEEIGNHATYLEAKQKIDPAFFSRARKFTVVRNPYHWLFSMYSYIKGNPSHHMHGLSFETLVIAGKLLNQVDYITDENGAVKTHVLRLESIDVELPEYLSKLGIEIDRVPVLNKSDNLLSEINYLLEKDFSLGYKKC